MQRIKTGDKVVVVAGASKGQTGEVIAINTQKGKVKVQGIAVVKRHLKPNAQRTRGSIEEREAYIDASNVMLVDPSSDKPTRVGFREDDGVKVRYAKRSGSVIPEPARG